MKIKAIASSHTTETQTAFKTEPPLTEEVLECALENFFGQAHAATYFEKDGLFIVARHSIPQQQIPIYEDNLTSAEEFLKNKQTRDKSLNKSMLERRAKETGLPVE